MTEDDRVAILHMLATALGVQTSYWDVGGVRREASVEALLAVLGSMGVAVDGLGSVASSVADHVERHGLAPTEPVLVAWLGSTSTIELRLPASAAVGKIELAVASTDFDTRTIAVVDLDEVDHLETSGLAGRRRAYRIEIPPIDVDAGYHELVISGATPDLIRRPLFVAPRRVPALDPLDRWWGVFAPIYSLPGGTGLGAHVGDLGHLSATLEPFGVRAVGTLPLLASWLGEPFDPSPYAPVSRRFWNELFVDLVALPEMAACPEAAANLHGLRAIGHAANERTKHFDYRHQYGFVRGVLAQIVDAMPDWPSTLRKEHDEAVAAAGPELHDYARFRAYADTTGTGWHQWSDAARDGRIPDTDVDPALVRLHEFGQIAMARDLRSLGSDLRARDQRLYLDLPVGSHGDGYDTWRHRDVFAWGAAAGAPPDDFFSDGQNWGFPPLRPEASRLDGHRHLRSVLSHHMATAGMLRLDHVMGLHRMFWVPDGIPATDGVYVRYPREELFAILSIEAHRHDCIVIGEDLGTVPDEIRTAMDDHGLLGMYVAEFNQPAWSGAELVPPTASQLATIDTHDTPTFTGWVHGFDIDTRHQLGLLHDDSAEHERAERRQQIENLAEYLVAQGHLTPGETSGDRRLLEGLLRFIGSSDAPAVLVAVDDLLGEANPQNVPGTMVDRPNWVQRVPLSPELLVADERVTELLQALQECRLGSHLRARGVEENRDDNS